MNDPCDENDAPVQLVNRLLSADENPELTAQYQALSQPYFTITCELEAAGVSRHHLSNILNNVAAFYFLETFKEAMGRDPEPAEVASTFQNVIDAVLISERDIDGHAIN